MKSEEKTFLVLASASPRRRRILEDAGIPFRTVVSGVDENVDPALSPEEKVRVLSARKAAAVAPLLREEEVVLGADTVVALGNRILESRATRKTPGRCSVFSAETATAS